MVGDFLEDNCNKHDAAVRSHRGQVETRHVVEWLQSDRKRNWLTALKLDSDAHQTQVRLQGVQICYDFDLNNARYTLAESERQMREADDPRKGAGSACG